MDRVSGIAHNKIIIIDNQYVLTGSYNWTKAANARNAENLLLINSKELAKEYSENWNSRYQNAYQPNSSTNQ